MQGHKPPTDQPGQVRAGALRGVRVIDLSQMLAGPYSTMLLADLGADVVKVEPMRGDMARELGPFLDDDDLHAFGGYFQSTNRNKRSIAIDLKQPEGRAAFLALAEDADVVIENFRHGVMDRLGIGFETLAARNPRLVYAAIRGYGDERAGRSPYADRPAFDVVAQAMGGLVGINGAPGQPTKAGPGLGDIFPGALATVGILAALREAEQTGRGQFVDVAMADAVLSMCERIVYQHSYSGITPGPEGNSHPMLSPFDIFPASDGWVAVAAHRDNFWAALCRAIDRPDLVSAPGFATNAERVANRDAVHEVVAGWTRAHTRSQIVELLGASVPCSQVHDAASLRQDPHFAARDMLQPLPHPGSSSPVLVAGSAIKLTGTPVAPFHRAPLLGEHTDELLAGLGYDRSHIADLREQGVLARPPRTPYSSDEEVVAGTP